MFVLMIRRPPRSTQSRSSAASDVYKRQGHYWFNLRDYLKDIGIETVMIKTDSVKHRRELEDCLLYTSPSPRDRTRSRMPSSA